MRSTGLIAVRLEMTPRRMKSAPTFFDALIAASGSLRKCASIRLRDLCRDLFLRVGVETEALQALVDGVEVRAVGALVGIRTAGAPLADDDHDLLVLQRVATGRRNAPAATFFGAFAAFCFSSSSEKLKAASACGAVASRQSEASRRKAWWRMG